MPPTPRRVLVTVLASVAGAVVSSGGCDRAGDAPRPDTVVPVPPVAAAVDSPGPAASSGWDPAAGPVLLVAARPDAAIIVFPEVQGEHAAAELQFDTAAVRGSAATLVDRTGATTAATLGEATTPGEEEDCVGWPLLRVASPSSSGTTTPWSVGFVGRARPTPIPLDSVGSLSPADSAALVAEVARLASAIPTSDRRLRGLPFFVQDVRRFRAAPGVDALVANVIRRVHQEANPLEERTLLIAERDSAQQPAQGAKRYTLAFHQRAVGHEETLEGSEVLAAFARKPGSQAMLVVAKESEGGVRYSILQRAGARQWRVRWMSALVRC